MSYTLKYSTGIPKGNSESKLKIKGEQNEDQDIKFKINGNSDQGYKLTESQGPKTTRTWNVPLKFGIFHVTGPQKFLFCN